MLREWSSNGSPLSAYGVTMQNVRDEMEIRLSDQIAAESMDVGTEGMTVRAN